MSGRVAAQLIAEEKRAVYTHCYAPALNHADGKPTKCAVMLLTLPLKLVS